ncbi:MAG: hypothetical protein F6K31_07815 [Symploca sp. SIO2G7]|nr:hypothetical protein [Symploca sp. SIO2G7]
MFSEYIFSGSLPEEATTYVTREADDQLYEGLKSGKFCYVLNSRQTGKSSLRVRTLSRLTDADFACAAVDLSFDEVQEVTPEQWYVGLIDTLIDNFGLELDLEEWWYEHKLLSALKRFRKFIEVVLLVEVTQPIVIFIDEIDSVLSLKFPTDDFFAFIRACHNQRADNPQYNRLTFCLLGVASPSNLIEDKKRTPFNIGQAITLSGFRLHEIEPLLQGLSGRFSNTHAVMQEILEWTGGQPFLTQKLCQLMVFESEREHPRSVEQVVREQIIDNWETQDEPEHLRTIRDRIITRDEQKAGYLLELYQLLWQYGEIDSNNTGEQSELQLSGLVVRREGKLSIYNPIYHEVFNQDWIEQQLTTLRPYSEAFRAWVTSGFQDESRLLQGKALREAQAWAKSKNLSYQDRQFLAASDKKVIEEQIAQQKREAELERERKDREAAEKRNQVLIDANRKAQRRIQIGAVVLIVAVLGAVVSGVLAGNKVIEANSEVKEANTKVEKANERATEANKREEQAIENEKIMQKRAGDAAQKVEASQKALTVANKQLEGSRQESKRLAQQAQQATQETQQAQEQLSEAQENVKTAEQNVQQLNRTGQKKAKELEQAQTKLRIAQDEQKSAEENLANVEGKYEQTQVSLDRVETEIETVNLLSKLAAELHNNGLSTEAQEAWSQASKATDKILENEGNRELKQAMLQASISLASLQLSQKYKELDKPEKAEKYWNKAEQSIKKSQFLLQKKDAMNTPKQWSIYVHIQRVLGSWHWKNGEEKKALSAYHKAFFILDTAWKKLPNIDDINTDIPILQYLPQEQPILSANVIENLHKEFMALLAETGEDNSQIKESLKRHYLAELNFFMESGNWRDADLSTNDLIVFAGSIKGYFEWDNLFCLDLGTIDRLWIERSGGKFGFSVQKSILEDKFATQPGRYETEKWVGFYEMIGWKEEGGNYYGYEEGVFNPKKARKGHLPWITWHSTYQNNVRVFVKPVPRLQLLDCLA